jgi:hypothetical protein
MSSENENQIGKTDEGGLKDDLHDRDNNKADHARDDDGGRHRGRWGRRRLAMIPLVLIAVLAKGGLVMLLWNYLMPELFHTPELNYIQALGLMILAKLLVGFGHGFRRFGRFGGQHHRMHHHRQGGHHRNWRMKRDLWKGMSDEERGKLREEMRKRWEG